MSYFTYILYSKALDRFYIGQTDNLERRFNQHISGKGTYSSRADDWIIRFQREFNSRAEAVQLETRIKKRGAKRFLNDTGIEVG
jgi:putative endonuclease